jgi:FkbM family methyltransferase
MQLIVESRLLLEAAAIEIGGATLWLRARQPGRRWDEEVVRPILEGDEYGLAELHAAGHRLRTVLDIGAHVGAFTLRVKHLWPEARVIAAEADPDSAALLAQNTAGLDGVARFAGAVVGRRGVRQVRLRQAGRANGDGNAAASRLEDLGAPPGSGVGAAPTTVVPALDVVELLRRHGDPEIDLLKLDCEGAEGAILERLAAADRLHRVGWIRGEWHFLFNLPRIASALAATHVFHLDRSGPSPWGSFLAHRKPGLGRHRPPPAPVPAMPPTAPAATALPEAAAGTPGRRNARRRVAVLFPHRELGGGETAMIAVAEGLRRHFTVAAYALDKVPGGPPFPACLPAPSAAEISGAAAAETPGAAGSPPPAPRAHVAPHLDLAPALAARFADFRLAASDEELAAALAAVDAVVWYGRNAAIPRTLAAMPRRPRSLLVLHTDKQSEVDYHLHWRHVVDATACVAPALCERVDGAVFIPNAWSPDRLRGRRRRLFPTAGGGGRAVPTLGFLGRLLPFKNVTWLIEHLAALDCNLAVQAVDTAELAAADLTALAAAHGVGARLRLLPPGPRVGTLLRSIDALVVLSAREGLPMVAIEAGALGVPVVATRVGALPELFAGEILFVDQRDDGTPDVESLRRALAALSPAWGARLRQQVAARCSRRAVAGRYAERLRALLDRPR